MLVHLVSSMRKFEEDLVPIQKIAHILQLVGAQIALDWFSAVQSRRERQSVSEESLDWPLIVQQNVDAIIQSDAVIIEGSRFNFSQGYQAAIALQYRKPVLNIYRKDLPEYEEWPDKLYVSGISDPLFHSVAYKDTGDLDKIVTKFLKNITPKNVELDLKITLDKSTLEYIDEKSRSSNKSRAAAIKDILINNANTTR